RDDSRVAAFKPTERLARPRSRIVCGPVRGAAAAAPDRVWIDRAALSGALAFRALDSTRARADQRGRSGLRCVVRSPCPAMGRVLIDILPPRCQFPCAAENDTVLRR